MKAYYHKRKSDPAYVARINAINAASYVKHKERALARHAALRQEKIAADPGFRSNEAAKMRQLRIDNPDYAARASRASAAAAKRRRPEINQSRRDRYSTDLAYRFECVLRSRLVMAFKGKGMKKQGQALALVGCTLPQLIDHLESRFQPGMSRDNFGDWVMDHDIPVSRFDLLCPLARVVAFHVSNIQPLWATDNHHKYNKYEPKSLASVNIQA